MVCWGDPRDGGDCSLVQHQLVKVQQVQSTLSAFVPWYFLVVFVDMADLYMFCGFCNYLNDLE